MLKRNRHPTAAGHRRGTMLVLIAVCLPLVILMAAFAVDVAWMLLVRTELRTATDAAARAGATAAEARDKVNAVLAILKIRGANVCVSPSVLTLETDEISVNVDVPLNQNALILPRFTKGHTIRASSTMRTERVD